MRKPFALARVAVILALGACSDGSKVSGIPEQTESLEQMLVQMGFRPDMIRDAGEYYVVEGDILFSKAALTQLRTGAKVGDASSAAHPTGTLGPNFQWYHTGGLVGETQVRNITVDLSPIASSSAWLSAARQAMTLWSSIAGTTIRFVEASPGNITVSFGGSCGGGGAIACGSFPVGGQPGTIISIVDANFPSQPARQLFVMVHELGHNIALRHTNWQAQGEANAYLIGGTPQTDANSVMNGGTLIDWPGFSYYDENAVIRLYANNPTVTITYPNSVPTIAWGALGGVLHYEVWYIEEGFDEDQQGVRYPTFWEDFVGSTTALTFADQSRTFTGRNYCQYSSTGEVSSHYEVRPIFPSGQTVTRLRAEVLPHTFCYFS